MRRANQDAVQVQGAAMGKWGMRGALLAVAIMLGLAAWIALGEARRGRIGDAVQTVTDGAQDASTNVQGKISDARTSARKVGLEQKVSDRLHGDKSLGAEKIEVTVLDEGTATLRGQVPDAAAKEKAVALARDTRGVVRVVDHVAVTPPPRVFDARDPQPVTPALATKRQVTR